MTAEPETADGPPPSVASDWASVTIDTPLSPDELKQFLNDLERIYRINPLYEFDRFERLGPAQYRLAGRNLANGREINFDIDIAELDDGLEARYRSGLKSTTRFSIHPHGASARLVVTETYSGSNDERRARLAEVDTSLNAWGRALHDHLRHWSRWSWLGPWRWYMRRVWQPMRPSARRVVYMLWVISLIEVLALIVIGGLIMATGGLPPRPS